MKFLLKLLAFIILAPILLGLLLIVSVVGIVGIPLLWEQISRKYMPPPQSDKGSV